MKDDALTRQLLEALASTGDPAGVWLKFMRQQDQEGQEQTYCAPWMKTPHSEVSHRALFIGALSSRVEDLALYESTPGQNIRVTGLVHSRTTSRGRLATARAERLRTLHAEAVYEIEHLRGLMGQLTTGVNGRVGNSIVEAGLLALGEVEEGKPGKQYVVAAPPGTGKTSHAIALMVATLRDGGADLSKPYGCLFVVDQIKKADDMFTQVSELLPGQIAVWTSDHDVNCINPTQLYVPLERRFHVDQLEEFPILVVTQAFLRGPRQDKARWVLRKDRRFPRALTIFDEQTKEVEVYDIKQSQAIAVKEAIENDPRLNEIKTKLDPLLGFLQAQSKVTGNKIDTPNDDAEAWRIARDLGWFAGEEAEQFVVNHARYINDLDQVFGFAAQMYRNYAFIFRLGGGALGSNFMAYVPAPAPDGHSILLDATADIDGVSDLLAWRTSVPVPEVRYDNLHIIHADHYAGENLTDLFRKPRELQRYAVRAKQLILDVMPRGARGLIICKKRLAELFPKEAMRRETNAKDDERFPWNLEGRQLAVTWWGGYGIGANDWKTADYVFQFSEHYLPKRTMFAAVQGLRGDKATKGMLRKTKSSNSNPAEVEALTQGHLLRFMKQMGMRGRARGFDKGGICGRQVLVLTCEFERLLANADRLFPGATLSKWGRTASRFGKLKQPEKLMEILTEPDAPQVIDATHVARQLGVKKWSDVSTNVLTPSIKTHVVPNLGWTYESRRGPKGGSRFVKNGKASLNPVPFVPSTDSSPVTPITVKPLRATGK